MNIVFKYINQTDKTYTRVIGNTLKQILRCQKDMEHNIKIIKILCIPLFISLMTSIGSYKNKFLLYLRISLFVVNCIVIIKGPYDDYKRTSMHLEKLFKYVKSLEKGGYY